jgi:anti-anti-sigma factor
MSATTITVDRVGSAAIVRIAGDVTSASEGDLMAGYTQAMDAGASALVLDFSGMEYMNSGGIGLLVTLLVRAQRGGGRLLATGLSDHYRQILSLTRIDEAIEIHDDESTAVAAATGAGASA